MQVLAGVYTFEKFQAALSVVLAHAAYLPSASCFVLLPLLSQVFFSPVSRYRAQEAAKLPESELFYGGLTPRRGNCRGAERTTS